MLHLVSGARAYHPKRTPHDDLTNSHALQVLSFLLYLKEQQPHKGCPHLIIMPASLITNWCAGHVLQVGPRYRQGRKRTGYAHVQQLHVMYAGRMRWSGLHLVCRL